jgi:acetyltransferase-like isoleucine patch superfamily enzyme
VRKDHRPLWLKRAFAVYHEAWARHFLHPQFDSAGEGLVVFGPQFVEVFGHGVRLGKHVHMMANRDCKIRLTTYPKPGGQIEIGDYSIVLPGVRIASAVSITTGKNCMFAGNSYVTDADWHDVYDRTEAPGVHRPVRLGDNVWIGDSAIVMKGVTIGDNSVVGAGAVVASDVPDNVIVAGNPARVVKELDPERELVARESLFNGDVSYAESLEAFERWVLTPNTLRDWLRSKLAPTREL